MFDNRYSCRPVLKPKICYICNKETTICLSTEGLQDFFYCCSSHLKDPGFAKPVIEEPTGPSQAEIDAVAKEWKEKQQAKADKMAEEAKEKDAKDANDKTDAKKNAPPAKPIDLPPAVTDTSRSVSPALPPKEELAKYYILHRHIYDMRLRLAKQKKDAKEAEERLRSLQLPSVPTGSIPKLKK